MAEVTGFVADPWTISQEKASKLGAKSNLISLLSEEPNASGKVALPGDPKLVQRVMKRQTLSNRQRALQSRFMPKGKMNMYKQQRATENYLLLNKLPTPLSAEEERNIQRRRQWGWATPTPRLSAERKEGQEQLSRVIANEGRFSGPSRSAAKNKVSLAARLASGAKEFPTGYNWSAFTSQALTKKVARRSRRNRRNRKTRRNRK